MLRKHRDFICKVWEGQVPYLRSWERCSWIRESKRAILSTGLAKILVTDDSQIKPPISGQSISNGLSHARVINLQTHPKLQWKKKMKRCNLYTLKWLELPKVWEIFILQQPDLLVGFGRTPLPNRHWIIYIEVMLIMIFFCSRHVTQKKRTRDYNQQLGQTNPPNALARRISHASAWSKKTWEHTGVCRYLKLG